MVPGCGLDTLACAAAEGIACQRTTSALQVQLKPAENKLQLEVPLDPRNRAHSTATAPAMQLDAMTLTSSAVDLRRRPPTASPPCGWAPIRQSAA